MKRRDEIVRERAELRHEYGALFDEISAILFRHDPIGLKLAGAPVDEYEPEAGTILPRLRQCNDVADVERVIHEELVRWFSLTITEANAATFSRLFAAIAVDVWAAWRRVRQFT